MKKTSFYAAYFAFTALFSSCQSCDPPQDCYQDYKFTIPVSLYPAKDTFKIGDTIWLESEISSTLFDSISQSNISFNDFEHTIYGSIDKFYQHFQSFAENNFQYINIEGAMEVAGTVGAPSFLRLKYIKTANEKQVIKAGIVPEIKGLYRIGFFTPSESYYTETGIIKQNCTETILMRFNMNGRISDNNYHILQGYPNINTAEGFINEGEYAFWVIE